MRSRKEIMTWKYTVLKTGERFEVKDSTVTGINEKTKEELAKRGLERRDIMTEAMDVWKNEGGKMNGKN